MDNFNSLQKFSHTNNLITNQWSYFTLQQEVSRGALLRKQKTQPCFDNLSHSQVKTNFNQPSTSKADPLQQIYSVKPYCKSGKRKRKKSSGRCPFRIAELALPTKRQCIESWRQKSRVMPSYMVERLKQRVMDERPVVQIPDAINCFKKRKEGSRKRTKAKCSAYNCNRMKEVKTLSAIFGFKIIRKLMRPLNITLDSRLEKINSIVKEEIQFLMLQGKNNSRKKSNQQTDTIIIDEMARKITLWAESILVDMHDKLLEENLRELEEEEGPVLDFIDELLERVASICIPIERQSSDIIIEKLDSTSIVLMLDNSLTNSSNSVSQILEEICTKAIDEIELKLYGSGSPSLQGDSDFRNDIETSFPEENITDSKDDINIQMTTLLDQVVGKIIHDSMLNLASESSHGNNKQQQEDSFHVLTGEVHDVETNGDNECESQIDTKIPEEYTQITESDITSEIKNLNEMNNEELLQEPNLNEMDRENNTDETVVTSPNLDSLLPANDLNDFKVNAVEDEVTDDSKMNGSVHDEHIEFIDANNEDPIISNDKSKDNKHLILKSEALETPEDDTEDNKKVKFSNIDMGLGANNILMKKQSASEILSHLASTEERRSNINLSPPNNHLLSSADESWPQHIKFPLVKVIASVNKSVTSLGKIYETDEKGTSSQSSYDSEHFSEIFVDAQPYYPISIDNNKIKDTLIAPFQNEREISASKKGSDLIAKKKDLIRKDVIKQLPNKNQNKSDHVIKSRDKAPIIINSKSQESTKQHATSELPKKLDRPTPRKIIRENVVKMDSYQNKSKKQTNNRKDIRKRLEDTIVQAEGTELKVRRIRKENASKTDYRKPKNIKSGVIRSRKDAKIISRALEKSVTTKKENNIKKIDKSIDNDDIFKWCKGLENVIENLETWNSWMQSTCSCIRYLKQKGNFKSLRSIEKTRRKWKMLHKSIKQDRVLWIDMKRRNRDGLAGYKKYYFEIDSQTDKCDICDCSKI